MAAVVALTKNVNKRLVGLVCPFHLESLW